MRSVIQDMVSGSTGMFNNIDAQKWKPTWAQRIKILRSM